MTDVVLDICMVEQDSYDVKIFSFNNIYEF
ncbi:hypothetical protein SAMN05421856_105231 [Chryseobacterium taichungense]|uniref:Uncharacterized protein n=1 Tax=Chryseobacterium taichungense TaxID=295069 RepID=A0A1H8ABC9_9FLAO|nr:hypothetical protein SAMN05421856_105231 [Chryseobacterium taichungense]